MLHLFAENFAYLICSICMFVLVILWLQSGLDKITDYKGNLSWLKGHFSKSMLSGMVPFLLVLLTILEVSAGITALISIGQIWIYQSCEFAYLACTLSLLALTALFFGQRLAKDYAGAASLIGYFAYVVLVILLIHFCLEPGSMCIA